MGGRWRTPAPSSSAERRTVVDSSSRTRTDTVRHRFFQNLRSDLLRGSFQLRVRAARRPLRDTQGGQKPAVSVRWTLKTGERPAARLRKQPLRRMLSSPHAARLLLIHVSTGAHPGPTPSTHPVFLRSGADGSE